MSLSGPALTELQIADLPARWEALGFDLAGEQMNLGGVRVVLGVPGAGITGWSISAVAPTQAIDGLPIAPSRLPPPHGVEHANGAIGLDHVVIVTPDFDRTATALEGAGLALRRIRETNGIRQGFRRIGPAILELVEAPTAPPGPARFWGLVIIVVDLAELTQRIAPHLSEPKPAVQPGRQIATLRRSAGLSPAVAFMTPEPARG